MISAVILTYNEQNIIHDCLRNLQFVDEILIFDSFSTDNTIEIAKKFNVKVKYRKFDNYASQRNEALKHVNQECDWILMIDADEIVTESLKNEILNVIISNNDISMFRVRRKDMFEGKWLKYSSGYPTWFPRLFKKGHVFVEREINEEYITKGKTLNLKNHLIHYPFNKGLHWWFIKHNNYSQMEALVMVQEVAMPLNISLLLSADPTKRRKFYKRLSYHLPFRPFIVFISFYFFKLGFLDGLKGYVFCRMRMIYESMIQLKFNEIKNK